jgi:hypothetical protein
MTLEKYILMLCLFCLTFIQYMYKLNNRTFIELLILIIVLYMLVKGFNKNNKKEQFIYSINQDIENEKKWGRLNGGQSNEFHQNCKGWDNLKYNKKEKKFVKENCSKVENDAFANIGPGDGSCYKPNNNTHELYKPLENIGINYPASSITAKYQGTDFTENSPSVNCNMNDPRKSLFPFSYNKCSPSCCPSPYSCSGGCVCLSEEQKNCFKNGWTDSESIKPVGNQIVEPTLRGVTTLPPLPQ